MVPLVAEKSPPPSEKKATVTSEIGVVSHVTCTASCDVTSELTVVGLLVNWITSILGSIVSFSCPWPSAYPVFVAVAVIVMFSCVVV